MNIGIQVLPAGTQHYNSGCLRVHSLKEFRTEHPDVSNDNMSLICMFILVIIYVVIAMQITMRFIYDNISL